MKLQRAQLLVFALCLALAPVHAEVDKQHRSRGESGPGSVRLKMMAQVSTVATAPPVTTRGVGNVTIYVAPPPTGDNATGDGSLATPYATIQFAFLAAVSGDEIRVLPGTYNECINNLAFALGVSKNLNVRADDWIVNGNRTTTIIDGTGQCVFPFSVVNLAGIAGGSRLEGFTVTGAAASGVFVLGTGVVTNNVISGNTSLEGGGVYAYPGTCFYGTSSIVISNNQITNNTADDASQCSVSANIPCNIDDNCPAGEICLFRGGDGGGVFVRGEAVNSGGAGGCTGGDANVTLDNNVIDRNGADSAFGGGMYVLTNTQTGRSSTVTITQNLISNNSTLPFSVGYGGGIWMGTYGYGTEVIDFINNTVTSNVSTGDGGGISAWIDALADANHTINVTANDVQSNIAEGAGGGMDLFVFALDLQGTNEAVQLNTGGNLILGNEAQGTLDALTIYPGLGGGIISFIVSQRSSTTVELNIFENDVRGNLASVAGGGIAAIGSADADPQNDPALRGRALTSTTIRNNLIAINTATDAGTNFPTMSAVGGGIFAYAEGYGGADSTTPAKSKMFLNFNTIAQNTADTGSGGIEMESYTELDSAGDDASIEFEVNHSIIYDNSGFGVGGPQPPAGGLLALAGGTGTFSLANVRNSLFMNAGGAYEAWIANGLNDLFTDALLDASFRPSQCSNTIDAGDPLISAALEPAPNGPPGSSAGLVNLGHTGGTPFAVTTLADSSGDGSVDGIDLLRLSVAFASDPLDMRWAPEVDLDRDMFISGIDLALMAADFARSCP